MPCATSTSRMPPRSSSITRKRSSFPATARRMAPSRPERRSTSIFGTVKAIPCSARARSSRATASGSVAPVESSRRARRTRSSSPPDVVHESTMATRAGSAPSPTSWSRASTALRCVPESLEHVRAAPEQAPELAVERGVVHGLRPQHRAATQQRVVRAVLALVRLVAANAVHQVVHGDDVAAQRGRLCARKARGAVAHDGDGPRRAAALRPTVRFLAHASHLPIFRNLSYRAARSSSVPIAPSSASSS